MTLEAFLKSKAKEVVSAKVLGDDWTNVSYREDENPDALGSDDKWLATNTSYIWKVGVLVISDANKMDWVTLLIGHEREPGKLQFIDKLEFDDGENDDCGRSMKRYLQCASYACAAFHTSDED